MREQTARRLRRMCFPQDYSYRNVSYVTHYVNKLKMFADGKGREVRMPQKVLVGMKNKYKRLKKEYLKCKKENRVFVFEEA